MLGRKGPWRRCAQPASQGAGPSPLLPSPSPLRVRLRHVPVLEGGGVLGRWPLALWARRACWTPAWHGRRWGCPPCRPGAPLPAALGGHRPWDAVQNRRDRDAGGMRPKRGVPSAPFPSCSASGTGPRPRLTSGTRRLLSSGHVHLAFRSPFPRRSGVRKAGVSHLSGGQARPAL